MTRKQDWAGLILTILAFGWIVAVSTSTGFIIWFVGQFTFIEVGTFPPGWVWLLIAVGMWIVLSAPLLPLAWFWRGPRYRAVFQTWAVAAAYVLVLAPAQLAEYTAAQTTALLQIVFTLLYIGLVAILIGVQRRRNPTTEYSLRPSIRNVFVALLLTPILVAGWLVWGALGSPLDTLLNLATGLALGLAAGLVLGHFLLRPLQRSSNGLGWDITLGGFVAGAALLMMAVGLSLTGIHLLLMVALPALGWTLIGLGQFGQPERPESNWLALAALIGLTAAAPLMFVDPDELALVLNFGSRDILSWANRAARTSLLLAWFVGFVLFLLRNRLPRWKAGLLTAGGTGATWLAGLLLYLLAGQPGFHGERLFVILADQADLSPAAATSDYDARRRFVYEALVMHANTTQADLRNTFDQFRIDYTPYYLVNALEVDGGPLLRLWLAARPEVDRVLDSPVLRPLPASAPASTGSASAPARPQWNLAQIGADRVWDEFGVTGAGIVVGQSDSGAQWDHPELRASYRGRDGRHDYNWLDPWNGTTEPADIGGHGTHTLGSILGQSVGVAPGATWYACANLARNLANPALYLDCMQFMLAPYPLDGDPFTDGDPTRSAHVLNNSWGCPEIEGCDAEALVNGVRALRAAGIFVVASAGNEGPGCESLADPIALYDAAFSVGAVDQFGELASFSSLGPVTADGSGRTKPDIVAPGVDVLSAYPGSTYDYSSGTSMAGPHVVGVVALVWSANPDLIGDIDRTEAILTETAQPFRGALPDCPGARDTPSTAVGYGMVDAYAAVERALEEAR